MFRSVRKTIRNFFKNRQKLREAADKARAKAIQKAEKVQREALERDQSRVRLADLIKNARPLRLVVGASGVFQPGWVPTDIEDLNLLSDADWSHWFQPNSIDAILAEHVWEHLSAENGLTAAKFCHRYLKPGGYLRLAIPDGLHPDPDYIEHVRVGGSGPGADDHKVLHTWQTLSAMLAEAGFRPQMLEYWDESGAFQYSDWDPEAGMVHRSRRFDQRNADGTLRYTSLIVDAIKA
jgi:predicted SAM-dependent methyltransferase